MPRSRRFQLHSCVLLAVAVLSCSGLLSAQTIKIPPSQCVVRSGDSAEWAAPQLDETSWKPLEHWKMGPQDAHIWVRCHADLSSLHTMQHPAILVHLGTAYEAYSNGKLLGSAGNLHSGFYSARTRRIYPLPEIPANSQQITLAFRITLREFDSNFSGDLNLTAGAQDTLQLTRASDILDAVEDGGPVTLCWFSIGIIGLLLLGLFAFDRSRSEALWLGLACMGMFVLQINGFLESMDVDYPYAITVLIASAGNMAYVTEIIFPFVIARRRVMRLYFAFLAIPLLFFTSFLFLLLLPPDLALRCAFLINDSQLLVGVAFTAASTASFAAFWPLTRIPARLRAIAFFCLLWGTADIVWFVSEVLDTTPINLSISVNWFIAMAEIRAFIWAGAILALLALIVRDQRRVAAERAALSREMEAAREVQQRLVPAKLPTIPGLHLDAAYLPAAEVGGDFYHVLGQPEGATLVVVGDVSGKGLKAAMTGALALGALQTLAAANLPPGELLTRLNLQVLDTQESGFITCICLRIEPGGAACIANAGHLSPYRNGSEVAVDSGFPLGITPHATYTETPLNLQPGDRLTLLSDGVLEARSASGELFGFERTAAISIDPAEKIARAASTFGQQDDITVFTIALAS
jgi:heme exporter protein D